MSRYEGFGEIILCSFKCDNFLFALIFSQEVITVMQEHHLIPDLITFGCLALGCHNIRDARQLLKDMDASQFR